MSKTQRYFHSLQSEEFRKGYERVFGTKVKVAKKCDRLGGTGGILLAIDEARQYIDAVDVPQDNRMVEPKQNMGAIGKLIGLKYE